MSPVNGVVLKVKRYKLYGQYDDVQVHIHPDGQPNVDVVMIHLSDVTAKAGDRVLAGVTPIGAGAQAVEVSMSLELGTYTAGRRPRAPAAQQHQGPELQGLTEE